MKKPADTLGSYVRKVHEGTQKYAQDLLAENDRLRVLAATLENDRARLEERVRSRDDLVRELDRLRESIATVESDKQRAQQLLLSTCEELDSHRRERAQLERQVAEIEKESRRFREQYEQVETQNSNLANLYVASYRLHGTLDRGEVLAAIREIVINLIGSEELALYEMEPESQTLRLVESFGIDPAAHAAVPVGAGRIGRTAATGTADIGASIEAPSRPQEQDLTACVPLKLDGRVTGALALFRLLPQKAGFETIDHELFDLLATHAATALYCTRLHERVEAPRP
jgi:hypothetical protein